MEEDGRIKSLTSTVLLKHAWLSTLSKAALWSLSSKLLDVSDVVPRMAIQRLLQPQLVKVVPDEANRPTQNEETVESAESHQILTLFLGECTTGANHVHERPSNAAIDVQNQVCSLASGNLFHFQGIVQHWCGFEVLLRKSLDDFHLRSSKKLSKMLGPA